MISGGKLSAPRVHGHFLPYKSISPIREPRLAPLLLRWVDSLAKIRSIRRRNNPTEKRITASDWNELDQKLVARC